MNDNNVSNENIREFIFTVDNSIIEELGERLVAKPSIALAELIKNSYDADATEVSVKFYRTKQVGGQIIVEDNGMGMNEDELINSWMRIGTIAKRLRPKSKKYKRPRAGSKGVGRFACQALSNRLVIETVSGTTRSKKKATMAINWRKFKRGKDIDSTPVKCSIETVDPKTQTGTKLTLISLKKRFDKSEIQKVLSDIVTLSTPEAWVKDSLSGTDDRKDPGFKINFDIPDFPDLRGDLGTKFLGAAWGILRGKITEEGYANYILTLTDELFEWNWEKQFPHISGTKFIAYYVLYTSDFELPFEMARVGASKYGRDHGGIRIYVDDFRIYPYGGPGNDWLKLDFDRSRSLGDAPKVLKEFVETNRPLLSLPRNSNLFGAAFLSRFTTKAEVSTARDKLIENEAYDELVLFVRRGIDWMTIKQAADRVERERKKSIKRRKPKEDSDALFKQVTLEIDEDKRLEKSHKTELKKRIRGLSTAVSEERKTLVGKVQILRVLASLGTSIAIFDHELSALLDALKDVRYDLKDYTKHVKKEKKTDFVGIIDEFSSWTDNVVELSSLIGLMAGSEARRVKRQVAVQDAVDNLVKTFDAYLKLKGIRFTNQVPPGIHTPEILPAEFNSIIINLLTNSIKAVLSGGTRSEISIIAKSKKKALTIDFLDTGIGLEKKHWEEVFVPFKSLHGPDDRFGLGTGLGLTIVRDIVSAYNGSISFVEAPKGWSTCLRIILPF